MRFRLFLVFSLTALLCGCATQSPIFRGQLEIGEIKQRINDSPIVERLTETDYPVISSPKDIELFYKDFHIFNKPSSIENWEHYHVLGKASSPPWKYVELANISVYLRLSNDENATQTMKNKASEIGGSAIIDLYKKPLTIPGTEEQVSFFTEKLPIKGYVYYGVIVRKKDTNKTRQPTDGGGG